jgi:chromosome segregation ATPase
VSSTRPRILILEDDAGDREYLSQLCHNQGYEPVVVDSFEEGEKAIPLAAIVLCADIRNGFNVSHRFRKDPVLGEVPLILTTAKATQKILDRHKMLPTKADEYVMKPFSDGLIEQALGRLVPVSDLPPEIPDEAIQDADDQFIELEVVDVIQEEIVPPDLAPEPPDLAPAPPDLAPEPSDLAPELPEVEISDFDLDDDTPVSGLYDHAAVVSQEIELHLAEIGELKEEIRALKLRNSSLSEELATIPKAFEGRLAKLEDENEALKARLASAEGLEQSLEAVNARADQAQAELSEYQTSSQAYESRIQELQSQSQAYESRIQELQSQNQAYESRIQELQSQDQAYESRIQELQSQNQKIQVENQELLESNQKNQAQAEQAQLDLEHATGFFERLEIGYKDSIAMLEAEKAAALESVDAHEAKVNKLNAEFAELSKAKEALAVSLEELKKAKAAEINELQAIISRSAGFENKVALLEAENAKLQNKINELDAANQAQAAQIGELIRVKRELAGLEAWHKEATEQIAALEAKLGGIRDIVLGTAPGQNPAVSKPKESYGDVWASKDSEDSGG